MSSMIPILFREMIRPMRMMEQQIRVMQNELMNPNYFPTIFRNPIFNQRPWQIEYSDNDGSVVASDKDKFQVKMDVQHFEPNEIKVKLSDNNSIIIVEAKHEEKADEKGFISRQLIRRFMIPEGHDLKQVSSSLSSDGVLTITAPKVADAEERVISITQTGPEKEEKKSESNTK